MNVFACMHVCLYTICVFGAQGDQKRALDPYRWCVLPRGCWELNLGPLDAQSASTLNH